MKKHPYTSYSTPLAAVALTLLLGASGAWAEMDHSAHHSAESEQKTAEGMGEIRAIRADEESITLHHEPMPDMNWPAMTMDFTLQSADQVSGLEVGDKVHFVMQPDNGEYLILEISPQ